MNTNNTPVYVQQKQKSKIDIGLLIAGFIAVSGVTAAIVIYLMRNKKTSTSTDDTPPDSSTSTSDPTTNIPPINTNPTSNWPLDGFSYGLRNQYAASLGLGNYMQVVRGILNVDTPVNKWKFIKKSDQAGVYYIQQVSDSKWLGMGTVDNTQTSNWTVSQTNNIYTIYYNDSQYGGPLGYVIGQNFIDVMNTASVTNPQQTQWVLLP